MCLHDWNKLITEALIYPTQSITVLILVPIWQFEYNGMIFKEDHRIKSVFVGSGRCDLDWCTYRSGKWKAAAGDVDTGREGLGSWA